MGCGNILNTGSALSPFCDEGSDDYAKEYRFRQAIQGIQEVRLMMFGIREILIEAAQTVGDIIDDRGLEYLQPRLPGANESGVALDIVSYAQTASYTCGYIAGLMIVHTFHPSRSRDAFRRRTKVDHHGQTPVWSLVRALRASGVGVSVKYKMEFEDLRSSIDS